MKTKYLFAGAALVALLATSMTIPAFFWGRSTVSQKEIVVVVDPAKVIETISTADFSFKTKVTATSATVKSCHKADDGWGEYLKYGARYLTGFCKDVTVMAKFDVKGYFDFKKTPPIITQKGDELYVDLGAPLVGQSMHLDADSYRAESQGGKLVDLLGDAGRGLERSAWPSLNANARAKACEDKLLTETRAGAEKFFANLLAAKYLSRVVVTTRSGTC